MTRGLRDVGAAFILVVVSLRGGLFARTPSDEAPSGPAPGARASPTSDMTLRPEVVNLKEGHLTLCGTLIREGSAPGAPYFGTSYHVLLAKGQRYRLDADRSHYPGLKEYLDRLPDNVQSLVHIEGTEIEAPRNARGGTKAVAVQLFQPLDHLKEMGVDPTPADEAAASSISKVGGLLVTLPPNYPVFDAIVQAVMDAGYRVRHGDRYRKMSTVCLKRGYIFAQISGDHPADPAFLRALQIAPEIRAYPFRNSRDVDAVPTQESAEKAEKIKQAGGLVVDVPQDGASYDAIAMGLTNAGFILRGSPLERKQGRLFARAGKEPDMKYVAALVHDPRLKVNTYSNLKGHIPDGEEPAEVGEPSHFTPARGGRPVPSVRPGLTEKP